MVVMFTARSSAVQSTSEQIHLNLLV